ncbi:hypothetical protein GCM10007301_15660 [Azorhizobium oxalatiphilum]|uniref:Uncharacterized protein n=1 Tax=Azorhizobium oxalatiphilum TaxID=980631 RepID=A0A917BUX1_9HYPH|nr:hypothetical protein [Azorhizobium oxalatiphilum]GGF56832.1 hypothetical protein GCM10007301_15660 [Azorhizobium oxalatiphilum]
MSGAILRVLLRYLAGILVARGLVSAADADTLTTDPDVMIIVETGAGILIGGATEAWYYLAKRFGWPT